MDIGHSQEKLWDIDATKSITIKLFYSNRLMKQQLN